MSNEESIPDRDPRADGHHPRNTRFRFTRRWGVIAAVIAVLVILIVVLARRKGSPAGESAGGKDTATGKTAGADSVVTLDSASLRLARVQVLPATASAQDELVANGAIVYDADRVAVLAPRAEGRIAKVTADLGQEVSAGQVLAIVESPDVSQTRGDLERARAGVSVAKRNYEREKRLFELEISPQKEMLDAEGIYRTSEADFNSAQAKLKSYGATSGAGGSYGLRSAVAGTVVERNASPGQIVGPASNVFTVADLRHVWIAVDVYEADLRRVHKGAAVKVAPTALPGETFAGRVTYAGGVVDSLSRTIKLRVTVENESKRLRPGMFAQVRIAAPAVGPSTPILTLPEIAVQDLNGKPVVFVQTAPGRFVARSVEVGARGAGGNVVITRGIRVGDRVVVQGAFQLKSELLKATFGGE
ncbi:MAG: efflux RND transporter periplasmic adaptor subunit [Gemmatimonadota bacterium]|nr:efflux RND transporter periplasmic adaptor subunit [Gemmatimonadota bacterium]